MCKLFIVPSVTQENRANAEKLLKAMVKPLTANDPHGFGYMGITDDNRLVGEKWVDPAKAFKLRKSVDPEEMKIYKRFVSMLKKPFDAYRAYGGEFNLQGLKSFAAHGRFATCGVSIENTHPFFTENHALIHNGVISNADKLTMKQSTCDSETILNEYIAAKVERNISAIQTVANKLSGYYACAVYARTEYNDWVLDVFKDAKADLYGVFVQGVGMVFVTSPESLWVACRKTKLKMSKAYPVLSNRINRFDVDTGDAVDFELFDKVSLVSSKVTMLDDGRSFSASRSYGHYGSSVNEGWPDSWAPDRDTHGEPDEPVGVDEYVKGLDT